MPKHEEPRTDLPILWAIGLTVTAAAVLALLMGGLVIKIVAVVIAFAVLQGLWRGAAELGGIVLGLVLAVPLAPLLGRGLEDAVAAVTNSGGLMARFIAMGIAALLIVAAIGLTVRFIARRAMKQSPALRRWNPYLGAALGAVEGSLLALMLLWAPLALEPIARAQLEPTPSQPEPGAMASGVAGFAKRVHESALGPLAVKTNPVAGTEIMSLATDFALVSRDPDAMAWLMQTAVMQEIESLPSVRDAVQTIQDNPELHALVDDQGASVDTVKALLNSPVVLELFDRTTIVADMRPLAPRLAEAIREAKTRVSPRK